MAKILVVDDSRGLADTNAKLLRNSGGHITAAVYDGQAALARLKTEDFDLVLSDYSMPGMNGVELAEEIHRFGKATPVLLTSADSEPEIIARNSQYSALKQSGGIIGYMKKGTSDNMLKSVAEILDKPRVQPGVISNKAGEGRTG